MLTRKQRDLLVYIRDYQDAHGGVAPSYDEMREAFGLATKTGIHRLIVALDERGMIDRRPGLARAIDLTPKGRNAIREVGDKPSQYSDFASFLNDQIDRYGHGSPTRNALKRVREGARELGVIQ